MNDVWRVEVEVTGPEGKVIGQSALQRPDGTWLEIDKLVLDSGQAFDLLVPEPATGVVVLRDEYMTSLRTVLGEATLRCGSGTLRLGSWIFDVQIVFYPGTEWLLGWPVLRHLDLLFRDVPGRYPCLEGAAENLLQPSRLW
jgi:hypothetical protein